MKIVNINNIQEAGVTRNPDIKKKILIDDHEIPNIMMFGEAVFKPGQSVAKHSHETMYEVFYVTAGKAIFTVNDKDIEVGIGDCITIEPKENHAQYNPYSHDVKWLYFGVGQKMS